ncbi:helix-turn-helix domain-containing protein [Virgibacillus saliphilus]|uniref:helix-turn-helix domain-containing protein n=1 Tax=Virgibacillus saliphilus TaxID=2831674 RepID=UPI002814F851|nr:helix-turn-helix domain-containing protein [Virgibacillus sp. NKC19-3]
MSDSNLLPYSVIFMATQGDTEAMDQVLEHYKGYIARLSQREITEENGDTFHIIDEEWAQRLELKLITAVNNFKF